MDNGPSIESIDDIYTLIADWCWNMMKYDELPFREVAIFRSYVSILTGGFFRTISSHTQREFREVTEVAHGVPPGHMDRMWYKVASPNCSCWRISWDLIHDLMEVHGIFRWLTWLAKPHLRMVMIPWTQLIWENLAEHIFRQVGFTQIWN